MPLQFTVERSSVQDGSTSSLVIVKAVSDMGYNSCLGIITFVRTDKFEQLCTVRWQASSIPTEAKMGPKREYHRQNFDLVLSVGLTEMKAWVAWTQNGGVDAEWCRANVSVTDMLPKHCP